VILNKIALISDIHFGVRNDTFLFLQNQIDFFTQNFIPKLIENKINTIIILGDVFDRRKFINFHTLYQVKRQIFDLLSDYEIHILTGNHDCYYKNSNEINSIDLLLSEYDNITVYSEPDLIKISGVDITIVPWINSENEEDCFNLIQNSKSRILVGHFEINGFKMYQNTIECNEGLDSSIFENFDLVLSGHFHQKSTNKKHDIVYIGAPSQYTWSDAECERGFYILDLNTLNLEFIKNDFSLFHKIEYSENIDISTFNFDVYSDKIIQIIVSEKNDNLHFDLFIQKLNDVNPFSIDVIDNSEFEFFDTGIDEDAIKSEDTISIANTYIDNFKTNLDKEKLKKKFVEVHKEAVSIKL
jgi:DNA repair exonuclease SbcCD nuclease subunit